MRIPLKNNMLFLHTVIPLLYISKISTKYTSPDSTTVSLEIPLHENFTGGVNASDLVQ